MPKLIDPRGNGDPLLGRLRGAVARHEIRKVLDLDIKHIYFKPDDAHFVFRKPPPSPLPEVLSNRERQLVVSKRVGALLAATEASIDLIPLRLDDANGKAVSDDYVIVEIKTAVQCLDFEPGNKMLHGYLFGSVKHPKEPMRAVPPLFRVAYSLAIACSDDVAKQLAGTRGLELVAFGEYVDEILPFAPSSYELLRCGTAGAELSLHNADKLEQGQSMAAHWSKSAVAQMRGAKSRKKIVDFTDAGGAPVITAKCKTVLEGFALTGIEMLPVTVKDHAGKVAKGDHWVLHVVGTQDYVDVAESDIEIVHGLRWTAREIVVDEALLTEKPAFFRVPGARYPWVFVRRDVLDAMTAAKLTGFRSMHPGEYEYEVEGGGIPHIC